jgi:hypothetical protein
MQRHQKRFETCKREKAATPFFECLWACSRKEGICKEQVKVEEKGIIVCKVPIAEEIAKRTKN